MKLKTAKNLKLNVHSIHNGMPFSGYR